MAIEIAGKLGPPACYTRKSSHPQRRLRCWSVPKQCRSATGNLEDKPMPKLKTHKGASKRFKRTGKGKIVRQHAFHRHLLTSKRPKRKRKLRGAVVADEANQPSLDRMLPY